jgi:hypothetical protein
MSSPDAGQIVTLHLYGNLDPKFLRESLGPYLQALVELQELIDELQNRTASPATILSMGTDPQDLMREGRMFEILVSQGYSEAYARSRQEVYDQSMPGRHDFHWGRSRKPQQSERKLEVQEFDHDPSWIIRQLIDTEKGTGVSEGSTYERVLGNRNREFGQALAEIAPLIEANLRTVASALQELRVRYIESDEFDYEELRRLLREVLLGGENLLQDAKAAPERKPTPKRRD